MRTTLKLTNEFHNSQARVRVDLTQEGNRIPGCVSGSISAKTARRIERELCGISGCTCGNTCGTRGRQFGPDGASICLDEAQDGSIVITAWPM